MSIIIVSVIVAIASVVGCLSYYIGGSDNQVEEACEEIIKIETGEDIDLSPGTPELKQAPTVGPVSGVNGPN